MPFADEDIVQFLTPQVRYHAGQAEMEGGLWPIFVVAMNDARGNAIARELLAGADIAHEFGESADDCWMLYYVTTERLPAAIFWLEDLSRFVAGELRPIHPIHQRMIDEVCESPAPHRAARRLAEAHKRNEVSAGLISKPATVRTFLDRLHWAEPLYFSAFQMLLSHHLFDLLVLQRRLIAEDLALKNDILRDARSPDPFLQIRQDAAREIHGSLLRYEVIKSNVPWKNGELTNPYANFMQLVIEGYLIVVLMEGEATRLVRADYLRAIRMTRRKLYAGEAFSSFITRSDLITGEMAAPFRFIRQRIESRSELSTMDSLYMLERAVEI
ncbi:MAG: hypothetical protein NTZ29_17120 [Verrucomicrobia bacterium]|nr:hypothetical protein [Verrucomicrobiota bacterium]